ncbi:hypothetical protein [Nakamurella endophytica]|uniref:Uncharacterized protein n=1 Tax=Nakamurella endophytica TaxID=1748367 RepID=A0A917SRW4_9ACTN|nr:hypothetical protein [Nakamurella endophytica]GGL93174.1 hypothetical protein GCM10011594_11270 [Nakamurella endophytica]
MTDGRPTGGAARPAGEAVRFAGRVARTLARTVAGVTLDVGNGAARVGEAVRDSVTGRTPAPGTLRVEVVILSDEHGVALCTPDAVRPSLELADRVFAEQAGIRVRTTGIRVVDVPAPREALDPRADRALLLDDLLGRTAFYTRHAPNRLDLVGTPLTVVVVRDIAGRTTGCSLGTSADWVITQAALFDPGDVHNYDETVLAHELGHALNLPHRRDPGNLMFPASSPPGHVRGTRLERWQAALLQANRHVVPAR